MKTFLISPSVAEWKENEVHLGKERFERYLIVDDLTLSSSVTGDFEKWSLIVFGFISGALSLATFPIPKDLRNCHTCAVLKFLMEL